MDTKIENYVKIANLKSDKIGKMIILTHLAKRANAKKCDLSNNNSQFLKREKSA